MALSMDGAQDDDSMYKSLLQELAQKKNLLLPVYATNRTGPPHSPCFISTVEVSGESYVGEAARTKKQSEMNAAKVAYTALIEGGPRTNNATAVSNIVGTSTKNASTAVSNIVGTSTNNATAVSNIAGTSSSGSSNLQTVITPKNEPSTSKMQTIITNRVSYAIPSDPEKAKGYLELKDLQDVIEKHTMTLPPIMIHQPQPTSTPSIVDHAKPDIKQKNHVIQTSEGSGSNGKKIKQSFNETTSIPVMDLRSAKSSPSVADVPKPSIILTNHAVQAGEGSGSTGKKIQSFVKEVTLNSVTDSGSTMPQSTKILIRPHVQGMTYDGPIQVSDNEWVAMKVNAHDGM
ncbi:hypothetical protein QVD17_14815 [Tagetes erecta]|uniref:DRBM domain-containing protein n=1 Tax=Tagetes erecta TaxID=13708 RepID=A0AAD8KS08_TARER|nr:hypothetical protein QVD17_14815 [Tagetes erecta]